jgi:hypothetical protein
MVVDNLKADASRVGAMPCVPYMELDTEQYPLEFYYQINIYELEDADAAFLILKYNLAVVSKVLDAQIV